MIYVFSCVTPPSIEELEHVIDNEKRDLTYSEFCEEVEPSDLEEVSRSLGYSEDFELSDDGYVRYFESETIKGKRCFVLVHSAIEYVFY